MAETFWSGFYKKTLNERKQQLRLAFPHLSLADHIIPRLQEPVADSMIENCIGTTCLPFGLALNFLIDQKQVIIPMAIEEPSVIAAVSGAAKLISAYGGFTASCSSRNIIYAQLQLLDIKDMDLEDLHERFEFSKYLFIEQSNEFCKSMKERGGGVVDITLRKIKRSRVVDDQSYWTVVHFHIDVCNAMGANAANNVAEGMAPAFKEFFSARVGFCIVSNLNPERLTKVNYSKSFKASFKIPIESLAYKGYSGLDVANRIIEGYEWALDDPYRAVTHNKGIMNGIDAVAIATGQDWRAIDSSCHAWASLKSGGKGYGPLTTYHITEFEGQSFFVGELELPLLVGSKGGVLKTNPAYAISLGLMNDPDSKELAKVGFLLIIVHRVCRIGPKLCCVKIDFY
jgi:degradative hydroxymethylglutaryl-CoA reductase